MLLLFDAMTLCMTEHVMLQPMSWWEIKEHQKRLAAAQAQQNVLQDLTVGLNHSGSAFTASFSVGQSSCNAIIASALLQPVPTVHMLLGIMQSR